MLQRYKPQHLDIILPFLLSRVRSFIYIMKNEKKGEERYIREKNLYIQYFFYYYYFSFFSLSLSLFSSGLCVGCGFHGVPMRVKMHYIIIVGLKWGPRLSLFTPRLESIFDSLESHFCSLCRSFQRKMRHKCISHCRAGHVKT